uniref:50S ribosomal protein L9, chloroplastic n=1 Tax=Chondria tumulosa TaxID=2740715 RepID=A0A896SVA6_9FLOR|nr:ribosomal protein L9 [Chondria tumulosa]QSD57185.1 ribosomal protein L9 [Chondria tumulosa]
MKKKIQVIIKSNYFQNQKKGTIINVTPGYAFNYLIPKGIVETTTDKKIKHFQMFSKIEKEKQEANYIKVERVQNKIKKISRITVYKKRGEKNLIFGTIKEKDILNWINKYTNLKLEKKQIKLNNVNQVISTYIQIQVKQRIKDTIKLYIIPSNI